MTITTYEGYVEKGAIRLKSNVQLPENLQVYVIVPEILADSQKIAHVHTPHLVHSTQAAEFKLKISTE